MAYKKLEQVSTALSLTAGQANLFSQTCDVRGADYALGKVLNLFCLGAEQKMPSMACPAHTPALTLGILWEQKVSSGNLCLGGRSMQ
eukprot:211043-Pelagomonas_calceolata.AAC.1